MNVFDLLFRCGLRARVKDGEEAICRVHGKGCGVARLLNPTPPRIEGMASGPHVRTKAMTPATPTIGEARLRLKPLEPTEGH